MVLGFRQKEGLFNGLDYKVMGLISYMAYSKQLYGTQTLILQLRLTLKIFFR